MPSEVETAEFWEEKYIKDQTPWDLGQPNPVFIQTLKDNEFLQPCKILIPGCGRGYDAVAAARLGYDVTGLDFSPKAISFANELSKKENQKINFLVKDIFEMEDSFNDSFDAVYDYTFFCAINPDKRNQYANKIHNLLKDNGKFVAVLFPVEKRDGGPPFSVDLLESYKLFSQKFQLCFSSKIINSIQPRKGREILQYYIKKKAGE